MLSAEVNPRMPEWADMMLKMPGISIYSSNPGTLASLG
jgi:hypothetical protein